MENEIIKVVQATKNSICSNLKQLEGNDYEDLKGYLRVSKDKNRVKYYHVTDNKSRTGEFIKQSEHELINQLAQKEYNRKSKKLLSGQLEAINRFEKSYNKATLEEVYLKFTDEKKKLIKPIIKPDYEYTKEWLNIRSTIRNTEPFITQYETENHEIVRSKSEKMIADKLFLLGIPYKYEEPAFLENGMVYFPDFTILNLKTRREVYFEHFGRMDDEAYCNKTLTKINLYQQNGIVLGKNFLCTFETSKTPFNMKYFCTLLETHDII